jgi:integrase
MPHSPSRPAAESPVLGRVTWHQFRHIHSSLLNDLNVPAKIAQEQLGQASASTTFGIYTHVLDASHRSAIEAVEDDSSCNLSRIGETPRHTVPASDSVT